MRTINKKASLLIAAAATVTLSGCDIDMTSDLYAQDVFSDKNLTFPSQMRIEVPSCSSEKIDELTNQVLSVFSKSSEASSAGCVREGMDSMMVINFKGIMVDEESSYDLTLFRNKQPKFTFLTASFHRDFQQRIQQLAKSKMSSIDYDDLSVNFTLNNDMPDTIEYSLSAGWVNGQPGQWIRGELDRREKVHITSTKAVSHLIMERQQPVLVTIFNQPQSEGS